MVSKVTRLQFHVVAYTRKNKYKGRYSIKEGSGEHLRWQQGCTNIERRIMDYKNDGRNNSITKKRGKRKLKVIRWYMKE